MKISEFTICSLIERGGLLTKKAQKKGLSRR